MLQNHALIAPTPRRSNTQTVDRYTLVNLARLAGLVSTASGAGGPHADGS